MKCFWFILLAGARLLAAEELASLCADRAAVERVYYAQRLGDKPPFETLLPPAAIEDLVRRDLKREAVLQRVYGVTVAPAQLAAGLARPFSRQPPPACPGSDCGPRHS